MYAVLSNVCFSFHFFPILVRLVDLINFSLSGKSSKELGVSKTETNFGYPG